MEDTRPEARLRSKLLVRIFQNRHEHFSDVLFNIDHSDGRLMYGDPANHSLGRIQWSCKP